MSLEVSLRKIRKLLYSVRRPIQSDTQRLELHGTCLAGRQVQFEHKRPKIDISVNHFINRVPLRTAQRKSGLRHGLRLFCYVPSNPTSSPLYSSLGQSRKPTHVAGAPAGFKSCRISGSLLTHFTTRSPGWSSVCDDDGWISTAGAAADGVASGVGLSLLPSCTLDSA